MNMKTGTVSLEDVLADYARDAREFDAQVLQSYISKYPEHARALQRYAHIQLTSVPATADEIETESTSDQEMLVQQSKLLHRMQQLRGEPSASEVEDAARKLDSIAGLKATEAAATAVFGSCDQGQDSLLLHVVEPPGVFDVPGWFHGGLSAHLGTTSRAVPAAIANRWQVIRRQPAGEQRFSATDRPAETQPISWRQAVEDCITDEQVKRDILNRD